MLLPYLFLLAGFAGFLLLAGIYLFRKQKLVWIPLLICLVSLSGYAGYTMWAFRNGSLYQHKFVGRYESNTGQYIELVGDNTWFSGVGLFKCNEGAWEYFITEDWNYIELTCKGEHVSFEQVDTEHEGLFRCRTYLDSAGNWQYIDMVKTD
jgi:hypothetical protein